MESTLKTQLIDQLIIDEGKSNKPYHDTVGKLTIGVGRNLSDLGLSDNEVRYLLANDVERIENDLNAHLVWWKSKTNNVKLVLLNMCFNLGIFGLLKFENTLSLIQNNQFDIAAKEMLNSKWAKQVGDRAIRLSKMLNNE
jgi:lysozyme